MNFEYIAGQIFYWQVILIAESKKLFLIKLVTINLGTHFQSR